MKMRPETLALLVAHILLFQSAIARSDEIIYATMPVLRYNPALDGMESGSLSLAYKQLDNRIMIYSQESLTTFAFELSRAEADSMVQRIDKYSSWNKKASAMGAEITKDIGRVYAAMTAWDLGWRWTLGYGIDCTVEFRSLSPKVHRMIIQFPLAKSTLGPEYDHRGETLCLDWGAAQQLRMMLDRNVIDSLVAEANLAAAKQQALEAKQKAIEDEFK